MYRERTVTSVDGRMKRLDASTQHLWRLGDVGDIAEDACLDYIWR